MNIRKAYKTGALVAASGAMAMMAASVGTAQAQQNQEMPRGWFKACAEQQDVNICNVQNIMVAETGQLLTGVSMIEVEGEVSREVFQVTVPSGRMLPPGITMQVDDGQSQTLEYMICLPDRCIAEIPMNEQLVNQFKGGGQVTFTSTNFQNQTNPINISLEGFTAAYDGEPMQQSDLEDRQRRIQDYVERNTENLSERLRQEQQRAREAD